MGRMQRVLISTALGTEPGRVTAELSALGAVNIQEPTPELPDVFRCEVPEAELDSFLAAAGAIPGVLVAEPDAWRFTQPIDDPAGPASVDLGPTTGPVLGIEDPTAIPE